MDRKKVLELDKICRVCISERKDMRPLFSEKVAEMLMECASVAIEPTEGWPDKICVQCVHSVSRCHAFKTLVERSDKELREYIKSLTVRVVIEDPHELKLQQLQQKQAKLLQLQQQQQALLAQQQEQQRLQQQQQQLERQQQKQQKILQKQLQQQQKQQQLQEEKQKLLQQQQQQQLQQQLLEEQQQQQQLQQQQQQLQQQQQQLQQQQQQQQQQMQQKKKSNPRKTARQTKRQQPQQQQHTQLQLAEPIALHSVALGANTTSVSASKLARQSQMLPTSSALPQQIVLPNGQVITTAQIVTHSGPPQIAQIISNNNTASNVNATVSPGQPQFTPQLIQTANGQTLQLIQQPNGQQTLQLVQLVSQQPQHHQPRHATLFDMSDPHSTTATLIEHHQHDGMDHQQLIEGDDVTDENIGCETIVVKEEQQLQEQHHMLLDDDEDVDDGMHDNISQGETQELEYLEDITVTTTTHQQLDDDDDSQQHHHHMLDGDACDDEDIIEEIHMEEEMLEDIVDDDEEDDGGEMHEMHVMDADVEDVEDVEFEQHLIDDDLQYTVIEYGDEIADGADEDVQEVLQVACESSAVELNASMTSNISTGGGGMNNSITMNNNNNNNTIISTPKKKSSKSAKASASASRQLAATASSIAAGGADDDFQLDQKFIAEFISQQTTSLGAGRYVCNLCRQEFKQFKGLQNHMHSHSNWIRANCKKQPQCEICCKSFKGPGMLKMHMKTHASAAKTPVCNICQKIFKSKAILYRHRQTHQVRSYSCGIDSCRKTFSTHPTLRMHMTKKHPNVAQPKFKCGECASLFDSVDALHSHVQHTGHGSGNMSAGDGTIMAASVSGDVVTLQSGQQVKLVDGMVSMSDVVVVTTA